MNNIIPFNAYPIFYEKTNYYLPNEKLDFLLNLEYYKTGEHKGYIDNTWLTKDIQLLKQPIFNDLNNLITTKFNEYKTQTLQIKNEFAMTNSWASKCQKNERVLYHNHNNSMFSFVYYPKVKNDKLIFDLGKSRLQESWGFEYDIIEYNVFNSAKWEIEVETGDLLIFPSCINHGTTPNINNDLRISIAGNFFMQGKSVSSENSIEITAVGQAR